MSTPPIDERLVRELIRDQFPQWANLPVTFVPQGWDHRTFRLGEHLSVRLPSAAGYVKQGEKERRWLPVLAPQLPVAIPTPVACGRPGAGYPLPWSIFEWIDGDVPSSDSIIGSAAAGAAVGDFLIALQRADPTEGPAAGPHSAMRGAPPAVYDADVRRCFPLLEIGDRTRAEKVWHAACVAMDVPPVWFHGDVAAVNLVFKQGELTAVLDFGCAGVGDPACDIAAAWSLFEGDARIAFLAALDPAPRALARARGWALWKALLRIEEAAGHEDWGRRVLGAVLS